ncbi:hypothetical protein A2U01_0026391, partial [Trifolium medium]|nr:hypothetical protein [Trifolium medium]
MNTVSSDMHVTPVESAVVASVHTRFDGKLFRESNPQFLSLRSSIPPVCVLLERARECDVLKFPRAFALSRKASRDLTSSIHIALPKSLPDRSLRSW